MSQNLWAIIMPFGPVTNILPTQKIFFGPAMAGSHFRHYLGIVVGMKMFHLSGMIYVYPVTKVNEVDT